MEDSIMCREPQLCPPDPSYMISVSMAHGSVNNNIEYGIAAENKPHNRRLPISNQPDISRNKRYNCWTQQMINTNNVIMTR